MNSQTKNSIRAAVLAGIIAWPTVEAFRLVTTQQQQAQAEALQQSVATKLASVRAKNVQVVGSGDATAAPGTK